LRNVFITNLVRCNPRDSAGRNRDPASDEIANCRSHLEAELAAVRPQLVVCLGRIAWRELAGRDALFAPLRPAVIRSKGRLLYPMYHPAYVNRGACSERSYAKQFALLRRLLAELID
jgi:DNA polymerase